MISESIKTKVARATVTLLKKGGQGVLVKNHFCYHRLRMDPSPIEIGTP